MVRCRQHPAQNPGGGVGSGGGGRLLEGPLLGPDFALKQARGLEAWGQCARGCCRLPVSLPHLKLSFPKLTQISPTKSSSHPEVSVKGSGPMLHMSWWCYPLRQLEVMLEQPILSPLRPVGLKSWGMDLRRPLRLTPYKFHCLSRGPRFSCSAPCLGSLGCSLLHRLFAFAFLFPSLSLSSFFKPSL